MRKTNFNGDRDYEPLIEEDVEARLADGASLTDGVSGRTEVTKRTPMYRNRHNADGSVNQEWDYYGF